MIFQITMLINSVL